MYAHPRLEPWRGAAAVDYLRQRRRPRIRRNLRAVLAAASVAGAASLVCLL